ncbi:37657_t:CDS:2 [Gigaspora margarita]|uniref:37657_t:CDS:1 n=1 Tax=Gigaspora margarita TaxID=4874 RepID=A0ABN7W767_GIGMA|nr:37657_t:CDS:2 [Gigaspora margarita]
MADIMLIMKNPVLNNTLKLENEFKPILVLLVDSGPDENPRHLKNIIEYYKLFIELNLDNFTVRTHAPGQSVYNPVECSMSILSEKLKCIVLPIDHFGSHLDSSGIIENIDLAKQNFHYSDKRLCDIWRRDYIHSREVIVEYVDKQINLFNKASDAIALFAENNGFLPPSIKGQDGHFLNPIHIFQYVNKLKILGFDQHCPSISPELYL